MGQAGRGGQQRRHPARPDDLQHERRGFRRRDSGPSARPGVHVQPRGGVLGRKSKDGTPVDAAIINTSWPAGLYTSMGQSNYGPAKAGLANMAIVLAAELGRYGVRVNAISPGARTRMTETIRRPGVMETPADGFDAGDPANISPLVVWLGRPGARGVPGRGFYAPRGASTVG